MQETTTETLAFRTFGPQQGHQLTGAWGPDYNAAPLQVLAISGDRFCAAGPEELVFGRTRFLHEWSPAEFVRVPVQGATIIRALASHEFVVAHGSAVTVFGPTGKRGWSTPVNGLISLNSHPKNARFSYCDASGGYICGDGKIKKVAATHIIWSQDGDRMAKINKTKLTVGGEEAEFPEEITGAGFIGTKVLAASATTKYLWENKEIVEAPEIVGPFGNEDRNPVWYIQPLPNWPTPESSLTVCTFSQGTDITLVDESCVFEPSDDDARAVMPFNDDDGSESAPCGAAIDLTSTAPVAKPFAGVTDCPACPLLYILDDHGVILAWSVVSKAAIKAETALTMSATTGAIDLPKVQVQEPEEKHAVEKVEEPTPQVKQTESEPEEKQTEPEEEQTEPEAEQTEPEAEQVEPEAEQAEPEEKQAEPEAQQPTESEEKPKESQPEPTARQAPANPEPTTNSAESSTQAPEPASAIESRHSGSIPSQHQPNSDPFNKPSALGSFGKPLDAKFSNTPFSFNTGSNLFSTPAQSSSPFAQASKPAPQAAPTQGSSATANPFASFANKSMLDAVKTEKPKEAPKEAPTEAAKESPRQEVPARPKPDFFSVNVDPGAGNITTTSTYDESESESDPEKDYTHMDISDRFGAVNASQTSDSDEGDTGSESEGSQVSEDSTTSSLVHVESGSVNSGESDEDESEDEDASEDEEESEDEDEDEDESESESEENTHVPRQTSSPAAAAAAAPAAVPFSFSQPSAPFSFSKQPAPKVASQPKEGESLQELAQLALNEKPAARAPSPEPKEPTPEPREPTPEPKEPTPEPTPEPEFDNINSTECKSASTMLPLEPQLYQELPDLDRVYAETNSLFQVLDNNLRVLKQQIAEEAVETLHENDLMKFDSWHLADAKQLTALIADHQHQVDEHAAKIPEPESVQPLADAVELAVSDLRQLGAALRPLTSEPTANAIANAGMPVHSQQLQFKLRQKLGNARNLLQQAEEQLAFLRVQRGEIPSRADLNVAVDIISRKIYNVTEKYPDILHTPVDMRAIASDMHDLSLAPPDAFDRKKFIELNNKSRQLKRLGRRLQTAPVDSVIS